MEPEWFWGLIIVGALGALGLAVGLARYLLPGVALWFRLAVVASYVLLLGVTATYVAVCPGCTSRMSYDSARSLELVLAIFWGVPSLAMILASVWLGQWSASLVRRVASRSRSPTDV